MRNALAAVFLAVTCIVVASASAAAGSSWKPTRPVALIVGALFTNWRAVIGPKNMQREHVAYWENALATATQTPEWQRDLERNFWTSNFLTGAAAYKFMQASSQEFKALWAQIGTNN